jgi:ketosteroid isomerase-like protein
MTPLVILLGFLVAQPDTASLFQAERAFAARSLSHGIDSAFLSALAPDGVLFRGGPVNGPAWIREHPGKPTSRLAWYPTAGAVSASGDLGITTGPWTFTNTAKTDAPPHFGHFFTVWKRQGNGEWKVAVDLGIAHPLESADAMRGHFDQRTWAHAPAGNASGSAERAGLLKAEEELLLAIDRAGTRKPLVERLAPDVALYRDGEPPVTAKDKVRKKIEEAMQPFAWKPNNAGVASSGDLAYSYGSYVIGNEKGNYLRIWRISPKGEWFILAEVMAPES